MNNFCILYSLNLNLDSTLGIKPDDVVLGPEGSILPEFSLKLVKCDVRVSYEVLGLKITQCE